MISWIKLKGWLAPICGFLICFVAVLKIGSETNAARRPGEEPQDFLLIAVVAGLIGASIGSLFWLRDHLREKRVAKQKAQQVGNSGRRLPF